MDEGQRPACDERIRDGKAIRLRDGRARVRRRAANSRRLRVHQGLSCGEVLPRREALHHRRRHQRDPTVSDRAAVVEELSWTRCNIEFIQSFRFIFAFSLALSALAEDKPPPQPEAKSVAANDPKAVAVPLPANGGPAARTDLNLLGRTDTNSGESKRNENVQFNLIDNNELKELKIRVGATATLIGAFE